MNMSDSEKPNTEPTDADAKAADACPTTTCTWLNRAEAFARREPAKAVACAFSAGLLLNLLPTRATTAVVFALARPVLIFLGMVKLSEMCPCNAEPKV
jgi:hypothetical protein